MSTTVVEREEVITSGAPLPPETVEVETVEIVRKKKKNGKKNRRRKNRGFKRAMKKFGRKIRRGGRKVAKKSKSGSKTVWRFTKRQARKAKSLAKRGWSKIVVTARKAGGGVKSAAKKSWSYIVKGAQNMRGWATRGAGYLGYVFSTAAHWLLRGLIMGFTFLMELDIFFWVILIGSFIIASAYWDDYVVGTTKWMRMKHRPGYARYLRRRRKIRKAREKVEDRRRAQRSSARKKTIRKTTKKIREGVLGEEEVVEELEEISPAMMTGERMLQELQNHGISLRWHAMPEKGDEGLIEVDKIEVVDPEAVKEVKMSEYLVEKSDVDRLHKLLAESTPRVADESVHKYLLGRLEALDHLERRPEDDPKKVWGLISRHKHRGQTDLGDVREGVQHMVNEFHDSPYYRHLHAVPDLVENGAEEVVESKTTTTATKTAESAVSKRTPTKKAPTKKAASKTAKQTPGTASQRG